MAGWSIEDIEGTYNLIHTRGRESRTVYIAYTERDAAHLIAMAELYDLINGGAPVEAFARAPKKTRRKRV